MLRKMSLIFFGIFRIFGGQIYAEDGPFVDLNKIFEMTAIDQNTIEFQTPHGIKKYNCNLNTWEYAAKEMAIKEHDESISYDRKYIPKWFKSAADENWIQYIDKIEKPKLMLIRSCGKESYAGYNVLDLEDKKQYLIDCNRSLIPKIVQTGEAYWLAGPEGIYCYDKKKREINHLLTYPILTEFRGCHVIGNNIYYLDKEYGVFCYDTISKQISEVEVLNRKIGISNFQYQYLLSYQDKAILLATQIHALPIYEGGLDSVTKAHLLIVPLNDMQNCQEIVVDIPFAEHLIIWGEYLVGYGYQTVGYEGGGSDEYGGMFVLNLNTLKIQTLLQEPVVKLKILDSEEIEAVSYISHEMSKYYRIQKYNIKNSRFTVLKEKMARYDSNEYEMICNMPKEYEKPLKDEMNQQFSQCLKDKRVQYFTFVKGENKKESSESTWKINDAMYDEKYYKTNDYLENYIKKYVRRDSLSKISDDDIKMLLANKKNVISLLEKYYEKNKENLLKYLIMGIVFKLDPNRIDAREKLLEAVRSEDDKLQFYFLEIVDALNIQESEIYSRISYRMNSYCSKDFKVKASEILTKDGYTYCKCFNEYGLKEAAESKVLQVNINFFKFMNRIDYVDQSMIENLIKNLKIDRWNPKLIALKAMSYIDKSSKREYLETRNQLYQLQLETLKLLSKYGVKAKKTIPLLTELSKDNYIKEQAIKTIEAINLEAVK